MTSEFERAQKVAAEIECPLCQMPALPPGAREYRRSATLTEANVPAGLLQNHRTKEGTWALIVVEAGELEYTIESPFRTFLLSPSLPGIIEPTVPHRVKVAGPVRFYVAFLAQ